MRGSLDATLDRPKLIDHQRPAAQQHPKDGQLAWLARLFIYMEHWKMEYGVTGMGTAADGAGQPTDRRTAGANRAAHESNAASTEER